MHSTQITLEDWQYERLKQAAEEQGRSLQDVIGDILALHLRDPAEIQAALDSIKGIGEDPEASGRDHDRFLYGAE